MAFTVYNLGTAQSKNSNTLTVTLANNVAAGDTIILAYSYQISLGPLSVVITDAASNLYFILNSIQGAVWGTEIIVCQNALALTSGSSLILEDTVLAGALMCVTVLGVSGISKYDNIVDIVTATGTGTTPTTTQSGLVSGTNYLSVAFLQTEGPAGDTFTQDTAAGWAAPPTRVGTTGGSAATNTTIAGGYKISNSVTSMVWSPTITSRTWYTLMITFQEAVSNTLYWVGGSGDWSTNSATNWATSSGGAGGGGVPTGLTNVIFDANSDSGSNFNVRLLSAAALINSPGFFRNIFCNNFTTSGLDRIVSFYADVQVTYLKIYGNMTLQSSSVLWTNGPGGADAYAVPSFSNTTTIQTLTTNGVSLTTTIRVEDSAGLTVTDDLTTTLLIHYSGVLTIGGNFTGAYTSFYDSVNSRTLNMGSGTWNLTGDFNIITATGATINGSNCNIKIITTSGTSFSTGGVPDVTLKSIEIAGSGSAISYIFFYPMTVGKFFNTRAGDFIVNFGGTGAEFVFDSFNLIGSAGSTITLRGNDPPNKTTLSKQGKWYVGQNSTSITNNSGLIFAGTTMNYVDIRDINGVARPFPGNPFLSF